MNLKAAAQKRIGEKLGRAADAMCCSPAPSTPTAAETAAQMFERIRQKKRVQAGLSAEIPTPQQRPKPTTQEHSDQHNFDHIRAHRRADGIGRAAAPAGRPMLGLSQSAERPNIGHLDALRAGIEEAQKAAEQHTVEAEPVSAEPSIIVSAEDTIPVYTDFARAVFKSDRLKVAIPWLLLHDRFNRRSGRMHVTREQFANFFCEELNLFGERQLRKIINAGEGEFWESTKTGMVFIYGAAATFSALGLHHISSGPRVDIPLDALSVNYGGRVAALWSAVHGVNEDNRPMSRATLEELTGVNERQQRRYEENKNYVHRSENYELIGEWERGEVEEAACEYGGAIFKFTDPKGLQGRPNADYIARRMPTTYRSTFDSSYIGASRKRLNRRLKTCVNKGNAPLFDCVEQLYADTLADAKRTGAQSFRSTRTRSGDGMWLHVQ